MPFETVLGCCVGCYCPLKTIINWLLSLYRGFIKYLSKHLTFKYLQANYLGKKKLPLNKTPKTDKKVYIFDKLLW